jgi:hypothetical protein
VSTARDSDLSLIASEVTNEQPAYKHYLSYDARSLATQTMSFEELLTRL